MGWRSCYDEPVRRRRGRGPTARYRARRYHRLHPFHHLLHGGKCTQGPVQAWALNRYYYKA